MAFPSAWQGAGRGLTRRDARARARLLLSDSLPLAFPTRMAGRRARLTRNLGKGSGPTQGGPTLCPSGAGTERAPVCCALICFLSLTILMHCNYSSLTILMHCNYSSLRILMHCNYSSLTILMHCNYSSLTILMHCNYSSWRILMHCNYSSLRILMHCNYSSLRALMHCNYSFDDSDALQFREPLKMIFPRVYACVCAHIREGIFSFALVCRYLGRFRLEIRRRNYRTAFFPLKDFRLDV